MLCEPLPVAPIGFAVIVYLPSGARAKPKLINQSIAIRSVLHKKIGTRPKILGGFFLAVARSNYPSAFAKATM
jgi:hypothetical protein